MSLIFPNPPVTAAAGFNLFDKSRYTKVYKKGYPLTFSINEPNIVDSDNMNFTGFDSEPTNYYTQLSTLKLNCGITSLTQGSIMDSDAGRFLLETNADIFIQCLCFVEGLTNDYRPCFGFYENQYGGATGPGSQTDMRALYLGRDAGESFYHVGVSQGVGPITKTPTTIPFDANPALFLLEYDIKNGVITFNVKTIDINTGQKALVTTAQTAQFTTAMGPYAMIFASEAVVINDSSYFGLNFASFEIRSKKIDLS